jgi:hypothetical protein
VLAGGKVAAVLGYPLPVRPHRSQSNRPFRSSFLHPCPGTRLPVQSSLGVSPSFTVCQRASVKGLSTDDTSLGVLSPYSASGTGRLRPSGLHRFGSPRCLPRVLPTGPTPPTTLPLSGFPNLSATSAFPHRPAIFQTGCARGVCSSGVLSSRAAAPARRRRLALVALFLRNGLCFPLGMGNLREAPPPSPRMPGSGAFGRLQGLEPHVNRSASPAHD